MNAKLDRRNAIRARRRELVAQLAEIDLEEDGLDDSEDQENEGLTAAVAQLGLDLEAASSQASTADQAAKIADLQSQLDAAKANDAADEATISDLRTQLEAATAPQPPVAEDSGSIEVEDSGLPEGTTVTPVEDGPVEVGTAPAEDSGEPAVIEPVEGGTTTVTPGEDGIPVLNDSAPAGDVTTPAADTPEDEAPAENAPLDPEGEEAAPTVSGEQPGTQEEADAISAATPDSGDVTIDGPGDEPPAGDPVEGGVAAENPGLGDADQAPSDGEATEAISDTNDDAELVQAVSDAEAAASDGLDAQPDAGDAVTHQTPAQAPSVSEPVTPAAPADDAETPAADPSTESNGGSVG